MTTATPLKIEPAPPVPKLSPDAPAGMTVEELERYGRLVSLERGLRRARALDNADAPPEAGPRDLNDLSEALATAQNAQAYYFSHPDWRALQNVREQVDGVLKSLNAQAVTTPQTAIQAAKITALAASLIARHAAKVSVHLDEWDQRNTSGGRAMRTLARDAEAHAARAAGLDSAQSLDSPRLLIAHVHKLTKELRRAEVPQEPAADLSVDEADAPHLDSALSAGSAADPELAEASQIMNALNELSGRARRAGHRLALDVRLHGLVETAQLRGIEMISAMARTVMGRYDDQGRDTSGRRNIAAMIFHYAEQRLERMRGWLDTAEQRDFGFYEDDPPERYLDALFEESRTVVNELRAKPTAPKERTNLQIRYLLVQKKIASEVDDDQEWGTQAHYPPSDVVAGMQTDNPVEARQALIDALRRRVENNPVHGDAHFLNAVADRLTQEIAGPPELTVQALQAAINADQVRAVAAHLVDHDTIASPLALSEKAELNVTHAQAERALAVLETLRVVGPPHGITPRETLTVSRDQLHSQLLLLEARLPNLLEMHRGAAAVPAPSAPATPKAATHSEAPPAVGPEQPPSAAPSSPDPAAPASVATAPELPRRDRSAERRHPGNLGPRPTPTAAPMSDQDLAKLLEARVTEISDKLRAGTEARAASHPDPAKSTIVDAAGEAQHNAQQQQSLGVGVR
ncbi:hypothetical protein [Streptomyces solaniscabiei]|uniref:hypothetical protein n=1 Tax=Streptomyces solaniscabiei TaxID=2683255 RepID=UPI001CE36555|nr:hypothetical protein [Streptomyces solaniscabiei]